MQKKINNLFLIFSLIFTFSACEKNNNYADPETQKINKFVLDNMDFVYYWHKTIENLNYRTEKDTYDLFEKLLDASYDNQLGRNIDQWSFITDDYQGLLDYFSGIRRTMGHSIRLFRISDDGDDIVGFIEYIEPNSPAAEAGLERGDMFYKIDGQALTINNYSSLLNQDSYTMTLGTFNSDFSVSPLTPSISLSAIELQTNPIHLSKIIEHGGKKIGYLMYKSFIDDYNDDLEALFADFKAQGVTGLVLDLRYNGGGAVSTAILLGSMIAPSNTVGEVFLKTAYNENLDNYFRSEHPNEEDLFIDRIENNVNNLNLNKVVVLSTYKTASASEMVIYGLSPHMEVYHIGEQTHGKYYGSITISDEDNHNWAIQPIVMRAENKDNSIDYRVGLIPDLERTDFLNASELYPLGDPKEDFLALALEYLTGVAPAGAKLKSAIKPITPTNTEQSFGHPLDYNMYLEIK